MLFLKGFIIILQSVSLFSTVINSIVHTLSIDSELWNVLYIESNYNLTKGRHVIIKPPIFLLIILPSLVIFLYNYVRVFFSEFFLNT